ncbi:MAG: hypothetical protein OEM38_10905 [Gammaproteobacteria bacterium]|nr:hypothetical protein [Gammaproteobacteria bacterium]
MEDTIGFDQHNLNNHGSNTQGSSKQGSNIQESLESLFAKAVRHHRYGELSKAEMKYKAILAREPNHIAAMNHYGVLSYQLDDFPLAEQMFEQAYSMVSFDEKLSVNLVSCKLKLDKPVEALSIVQVILANNPDSEIGNKLISKVQVPELDCVD